MSEKQKQFDNSYLEMAAVLVKKFLLQEETVGAYWVKNRMIISDGSMELLQDLKMFAKMKPVTQRHMFCMQRLMHITKVAKSGNSSEGCHNVCNTAPCLECAKLIIQAGIIRLVYRDNYRITDGIDPIDQSGVEIVNLTD